MNWYSEIVNDLSVLPNAIDYYESELITAREECRLSGNLEKLLSLLPTQVEMRYKQLQEVEAILEYLNISLRKLKSDYYKKYLETYQRALQFRDIERYVNGELEVVNHEELVNLLALTRNKYLGITKAMDQKSFSINNIVKLRVAGLEDASL